MTARNNPRLDSLPGISLCGAQPLPEELKEPKLKLGQMDAEDEDKRLVFGGEGQVYRVRTGLVFGRI